MRLLPQGAAVAKRRLLLVALDAMEIAWLRRLIAEGRLPNLAAFCSGAHELPVRSDGDTLHGSIWPTFASAMGPGHHGRYWWLQWLPSEMRFVRSSHPAFDYQPFWQGLAEAGKRVAVVDVPYAPLARHPLVHQISGWGIHDEVAPESWPDDALPQLRRAWGAHPLSFDTVEPHSPRDLLRMAEKLSKGVAMRARLLEQLAGDRQCDLVVVLFGETHKAGHYLAEEREVVAGKTNLDLIAEVLQPLDEAWPRVLAAAGEGTTVALFALHGMQHQVDYSVLGRLRWGVTWLRRCRGRTCSGMCATWCPTRSTGSSGSGCRQASGRHGRAHSTAAARTRAPTLSFRSATMATSQPGSASPAARRQGS